MSPLHLRRLLAARRDGAQRVARVMRTAPSYRWPNEFWSATDLLTFARWRGDLR